MTKEEIIERFKSKPYLIEMGAGKLSRWFGVSEDVIREAKDAARVKKSKVIDHQRVLFIDIETAPMTAYVWGRWKQNIGLSQSISEWFCLSYAAKWANEDIMYSEVLTPEEALNQDDSRIMKTLWLLLNKADTVIAHNGLQFDNKKINTRFLLHGFKPTRPFRVIDTLKVVKDGFSFSSNKLDHILKEFGLERKLDTDFSLWKGCMNGDLESLQYMKQYNEVDVYQLEKAFLRLKPWIKNFPNFTLFNSIADGEYVCPACGGKHIYQDGYYTTWTYKYKLFRCDDCGSISRLRKAEKTDVKLINNIR